MQNLATVDHTNIVQFREAPVVTRNEADEVVRRFLAGRRPTTLAAYQRDLDHFADFVDCATPERAIYNLLSLPHGKANGIGLDYRNKMLEDGRAANTINRRLSTLRACVQHANVVGVVSWQLQVKNTTAQAYKDTSGCGLAGYQKLLRAAVSQRDTIKALRDKAIVTVMHDLALRRAEACNLTLGDIDRADMKISVLGKGRDSKERLTLPPTTLATIEAWLSVRPDHTSDALFTSLNRNGKGDGKLTGNGMYTIIRKLGVRAGMGVVDPDTGKQVTRHVWPHQLRHSSITTALDLGHDIRKVAKHSRHRDIRTVSIYDDNLKDFQGDIAAAVAKAGLIT